MLRFHEYIPGWKRLNIWNTPRTGEGRGKKSLLVHVFFFLRKIYSLMFPFLASTGNQFFWEVMWVWFMSLLECLFWKLVFRSVPTSNLHLLSLPFSLSEYGIVCKMDKGKLRIRLRRNKSGVSGLLHKESESQYFLFFDTDDLFSSQLCCCYSRWQEESFYNVFVHEIITFCTLNIL